MEVNSRRAELTEAYSSIAKELTTSNVRVVGSYKMGKVIGRGSFGTVYMATHVLTGTKVAVKRVPKKGGHVGLLTREIHHHRRLRHSTILALYEIVVTESSIYLVTELCRGGELYDYVSSKGYLSVSEARRIEAQLVLGVAYLHNNGVVHRDLKLENILLDENRNARIADFGLGREFEPNRLLRTSVGTLSYCAPEIVAGQPYRGPEVDIWSLGVILFAMLMGYLPFDVYDETGSLSAAGSTGPGASRGADTSANNVMATSRRVQRRILTGSFDIPADLDRDAAALICDILQLRPLDRPSPASILRSRFFNPLQLYDERNVFMKQLSESRSAALALSPHDNRIIRVLESLGFDARRIRKSVLSHASDPCAALWWILHDKFAASGKPLHLSLESLSLEADVPPQLDQRVDAISQWVSGTERSRHVSESAHSDLVHPDVTHLDSSRPDSSRPESTHPGSTHLDATHLDSTHLESEEQSTGAGDYHIRVDAASGNTTENTGDNDTDQTDPFELSELSSHDSVRLRTNSQRRAPSVASIPASPLLSSSSPSTASVPLPLVSSFGAPQQQPRRSSVSRSQISSPFLMRRQGSAASFTTADLPPFMSPPSPAMGSSFWGLDTTLSRTSSIKSTRARTPSQPKPPKQLRRRWSLPGSLTPLAKAKKAQTPKAPSAYTWAKARPRLRARPRAPPVTDEETEDEWVPDDDVSRAAYMRPHKRSTSPFPGGRPYKPTPSLPSPVMSKIPSLRRDVNTTPIREEDEE